MEKYKVDKTSSQHYTSELVPALWGSGNIYGVHRIKHVLAGDPCSAEAFEINLSDLFLILLYLRLH